MGYFIQDQAVLLHLQYPRDLLPLVLINLCKQVSTWICWFSWVLAATFLYTVLLLLVSKFVVPSLKSCYLVHQEYYKLFQTHHSSTNFLLRDHLTSFAMCLPLPNTFQVIQSFSWAYFQALVCYLCLRLFWPADSRFFCKQRISTSCFAFCIYRFHIFHLVT